MNRRLLHTPEGVRDLYGKECSDRSFVINTIGNRMKSYGFETIDTPTFEFFDVFAEEISSNSEKELYKFFDQDGNTMVLRPDFTPSVARCVSKYFLEDEEPVRFCYSGKTFLNTHSLQGKLKEVSEIGAELMNDGSIFADAEMIALLVESISATGLNDFKVSIGDADYYYGICEEAGIDFDTEEAIREKLVSRNTFAADLIMEESGISEKYRELIKSVSTCIGNAEVLEEAGKLVNNKRSQKAISHLQSLYQVLCNYGIQDYISFDLGMLSKFNYYTGVMFGAYTYGVGDAIAKGGRYDDLLDRFGKSAPSIGFMINLDDLMKALYNQKIQLPEEDKPIVIEYDENSFKDSLSKAKELRKQGTRVILKGAK
ncbi:ATP phosphoribosyltransferase regulatory subunit [Butyrivibrio sp. WCD2001]|uniref:ATP phosphoribosyltransferase regulatory subunit n=1 Tax=Butyrivibrio sp. WCD2001 TaxID=1280681 RepID=UPI0004079A6B|nr:ATP phosphoribosyltransferase regulatory subunit [Butyrivibrio sp. WCD2001]